MLKFDKVNTIYRDGGGASFIIYHSVVLHIHITCLGGLARVGGDGHLYARRLPPDWVFSGR